MMKNVVAMLLMLVSLGALSASGAPVSFCFNDWPPLAMKTAAGPEGISITIIKEAARRLGKEVTFQELPWNRCLQQVRDGEIDAVIDAAKRAEFIQGPASFSIFSDTFWVRNDSNINSYADIQGGRIGLVNGYNYNDRLLAHITALGLQHEYAVDDPTNIQKLAFGRVETVIADLASTLHFVRHHKLKIHPILPPYSFDRLYGSFHGGKRDIQRQFDHMFATLLEEGFVDAVYQQYLGINYSDLLDID